MTSPADIQHRLRERKVASLKTGELTPDPLCTEAADTIAQLVKERDGWQRMVGEIVAAVPLKDTVGAGASVKDLIEYIKGQIARASKAEAEAATLREALEEIAASPLRSEFREIDGPTPIEDCADGRDMLIRRARRARTQQHGAKE
jgi:hypothetical protein